MKLSNSPDPFSKGFSDEIIYQPKKSSPLTDGSYSLPVCVLKADALENNLRFMKNLCFSKKIELFPHGKTTMSPYIFQKQIENGATGITVATLPQLKIAIESGIKKIIIANQLVGKKPINYILKMTESSDITVYSLTDSLDHVKYLLSSIDNCNNGSLNLLIECGIKGKRTGLRNFEDAILLAKTINESNGKLKLCGIEGYEGLITGSYNKDISVVDKFLNNLAQVFLRCYDNKLFSTDFPILSAGGTAYIDRVQNIFTSILSQQKKVRCILRSGCYVTHDHGFYDNFYKNSGRFNSPDHLKPALEVLAYVQSVPEIDLVIFNLGKRDISTDIEPPFLLKAFGNNNNDTIIPYEPSEYLIESISDHHISIRFSIEHRLKPGNVGAFGLSHPCTTFDKWRNISQVDNKYRITRYLRTYF